MRDNNLYSQFGAAQPGILISNNNILVPQPTRFASCAERLEAQVSALNELTTRANRVADRLGGSVPEAVAKDGTVLGRGSSIAHHLEESLNDLDVMSGRLSAILERLETL